MTNFSSKLTYWLSDKYFQRFEEKNIQDIRSHFKKLTSIITKVRPSSHHRIRKAITFVSEQHWQKNHNNHPWSLPVNDIAKQLFVRNFAHILADYSYGLTHNVQQIAEICQPLNLDTQNYLNEIKQQSGSVILNVHGACEFTMAMLVGHGIPTGTFYKPFAVDGLNKFSEERRFGQDLANQGGLMAKTDAKGALAMSRFVKRKGSSALFFIDSIPRTINAINVKLFNRSWSIPMFGINLAIKHKKPIYFISNAWDQNGLKFKLTKISEGENIDLNQVLFACRENFIEYLNMNWTDYYWQSYPLKSLSYLSDHQFEQLN